ncbi:MAG: hypothetical protein IRY99_19385 [Isosphaeraceae bacterium]|nr:hypothetical protein [Isosphaeraceae bacterium]
MSCPAPEFDVMIRRIARLQESRRRWMVAFVLACACALFFLVGAGLLAFGQRFGEHERLLMEQQRFQAQLRANQAQTQQFALEKQQL